MASTRVSISRKSARAVSTLGAPRPSRDLPVFFCTLASPAAYFCHPT
jgi:hypothetical protein